MSNSIDLTPLDKASKTISALIAAGADLAIAVEALKLNARNAEVFAFQARQQWKLTLEAIRDDRIETIEKPLRVPLRIVSTSKEHLHADLETLDHEHRS